MDALRTFPIVSYGGFFSTTSGINFRAVLLQVAYLAAGLAVEMDFVNRGAALETWELDRGSLL